MTSPRKTVLALLVAALGAFSAMTLAACSEDDITGDEGEEVSVVLREFDISPERIEVAAGDVEFVANNEGDRVHELAIRTPSGLERTGEIKPGETGRMTVDLPQGSYRIYDPRDDYRDRGMSSRVVAVRETDATVTERTVERTVIEEDDPDVEVPEVQEPEVQEPEVQAPPPPPPPPPARTVTQVVPAPEPPPAEEPAP